MTLPAVLLKLSLLYVASKSFTIAFTPPNPPAKRKVRGTFFETYVHQIVTVIQVSSSSMHVFPRLLRVWLVYLRNYDDS